MKGSSQPWFLYHVARSRHFDNNPTTNGPERRSRTVYADYMVQMDDVLKRLVAKLYETGQLENTMIVLSSDNGPECEVPPHGHTPFPGCKGSSWEGGVRVPTFVGRARRGPATTNQ